MANVNLAAVQPGERTNPDGKPVRNRLLLALGEEEFQSIRPYLQFVNLPHHLSLHQPHRTVKYAHFPNEGLISLVVDLKDGKSVEAGLLGKDGASGLPALLGLSRSPLREVMQIAGNGFRVSIGTLREVVQSAPRFQAILM